MGFLGGEVEGGLRRAGPGALAGRAQLCAGHFGEAVRAHGDEHVLRGAKLLACVPSPLGPPQPLTEEQVRAGELDRDPGSLPAG